MRHEAILETINAEPDDAEAATLQSVWETLRQAKQNPAELPAAVGGQTSLRSRPSTASEKPLVFIGENPPFDPTICHRTGKFPFLFINENIMVILLDFDKQKSRIWAPLQRNQEAKLS